MKNVVVASLVLSTLVGCLGLPQDEPFGVAEQASTPGAKPGHCPDPSDCTVSNGGGVYAEEGGHVGFGTHDFMIQRFENRVLPTGEPVVAWVGRYQASPGHYTDTSGYVGYAYYDLGGSQTVVYRVTSLTENFTALTVNLQDMDFPSRRPIVTGADLLHLRLFLTTPVPFGEDRFTLYFAASNPPPLYAYGTDKTVERYVLNWYLGDDGTEAGTGQPYCQHQGGLPDYAVFQQGIQVDPLDAKTHFGMEDSVTLSCMGGAIATARWWGYPYRNINDSYRTLFEAAMHMKRASYCGDITFYTQANTSITLNDAAHIHVATGFTNSSVEARWGRAADGTVRALCVNPLHERRRGIPFPPTGPFSLPFIGDCYRDTDGAVIAQIPPCDSSIVGVVADMP